MRRICLTGIILVLLLVACNQAAASLINPTATPASQPTATRPDPGPTSQPSAEPTTEPANAAATVYHLVPGESQVTYSVDEVFIDENNRLNTAHGVTTLVNGDVTVDQAHPQNSNLGTITVDISKFKSDSARRDSDIRRRFLESSRFPIVTFVPDPLQGLPASYQEGQEIPLTVTGDLTIRTTTRPVKFDTTVKLANGQLTITGETNILMSDFGFGPISLLGILKTSDEVKVAIDLVARP
jgi:polyisoprenoid-binding protein YceI